MPLFNEETKKNVKAFIKENKKRVSIGLIGIVVLIILAFVL